MGGEGMPHAGLAQEPEGLGFPQTEPMGTRACGGWGEGWREAGKRYLCIQKPEAERKGMG